MELTYFGSQVQWTPMTTKTKGKEGYTSLWMEINEKPKKKFGERYGSAKSNEWVVSRYKLGGGSFGVKVAGALV